MYRPTGSLLGYLFMYLYFLFNKMLIYYNLQSMCSLNKILLYYKLDYYWAFQG